MKLRNAVEANNAGDKEVGNHHHLKSNGWDNSSSVKATSMTTPTTPRVDKEDVPNRVAPAKNINKITDLKSDAKKEENSQIIDQKNLQIGMVEISSLQPVASCWLPPGRGSC